MMVIITSLTVAFLPDLKNFDDDGDYDVGMMITMMITRVPSIMVIIMINTSIFAAKTMIMVMAKVKTKDMMLAITIILSMIATLTLKVMMTMTAPVLIMTMIMIIDLSIIITWVVTIIVFW